MENKKVYKNVVNQKFYNDFIKFAESDLNQDFEKRNMIFETKLYKNLKKLASDFVNQKVILFDITEKNEMICDLIHLIFTNCQKYKINKEIEDNSGSLFLFIRFQFSAFLKKKNDDENRKMEKEFRFDIAENNDEKSKNFEIEDETQLLEIEKLFYTTPKKVYNVNNINKHIQNLKQNRKNYYKNEFENEVKVGKVLIEIYNKELLKLDEIEDETEFKNNVIEYIKEKTQLTDLIQINYILHKYFNELQ